MNYKLPQVWGKIFKAVYGRMLTAASGLALTVLLPFFYTAEEVGSIYLVITFATIFSVFSRFGLDYKVNEELAKARGNEFDVKVSFFVAIVLFSVAAVGIWSLVYLLASFFQGARNFLEGSFISVVFLGLAYTFSFFLFQLYKLDGAVVKASLSRGFIHSSTMLVGAALLSFSLFDGAGLEELFFLVFMATIANISFYIYGQWARWKEDNKGVKVNVALVPGSARFMFYSLLAFAVSDVDYVFIGYYMGPSDLAVYATMKRIALIAAIFIDIGNVVLPKIFKDGLSEDKMMDAARVARRMALGASILSLLAFLSVLLFGEYLIRSVWGDEYISGYVPLCILMAAFTFVVATGFSEVFLLLKGDRGALLLGMGISAVIVVLGNALLVPLLGGVGAAISFFISSVAMRVQLLFFVFKKHKIKLYAGWA